jgi:hypothetical protein
LVGEVLPDRGKMILTQSNHIMLPIGQMILIHLHVTLHQIVDRVVATKNFLTDDG